MKKRLVCLLIVIMFAVALCACAKEEGNKGSQTSQDAVTTPADDSTDENADKQEGSLDSVSVLSDVWATYGEDEKFYGMGGDMNNMVENAPGLFSLEDKEALTATLLVQGDAVDMIDEAASLVHGMNLNVFTGAAFHLTDPANAEVFAKAMETNIINNQWMCGSPDQYVIYLVGEEHVVMAFGAVDVLPVFKEKFMVVHGDNAKVLAEGNVAQ